MPGPRNKTAKRRVSMQKEKTKARRKVSATSAVSVLSTGSGSSGDSSEEVEIIQDEEDFEPYTPLFAPQPRIASPSHGNAFLHPPFNFHPSNDVSYSPIQQLENQLSKASFAPSTGEDDGIPHPCIHDPGNGPRVKDLMSFLKSAISSPPSWDVEDCMEYHHQEVFDFLITLLPFEQAVVSIGLIHF